MARGSFWRQGDFLKKMWRNSTSHGLNSHLLAAVGKLTLVVSHFEEAVRGERTTDLRFVQPAASFGSAKCRAGLKPPNMLNYG